MARQAAPALKAGCKGRVAPLSAKLSNEGMGRSLSWWSTVCALV